MTFKKYTHIERLGTSSTTGILDGTCYIFPKIDGTNAQIWMEDGELHFGSRNRELSLSEDNANFMKLMLDDKEYISKIKYYLEVYPDRRLFGEFLVPHTLRTYRDDTWKKFYIFDVAVDIPESDSLKYLSYDDYYTGLSMLGLDYIQPMLKIKNPTDHDLQECLKRNTYLIQDGEGTGEGIVIKNYDFVNQFGRPCFAKIVKNEFKEKHGKTKPMIEKENNPIEYDIIDKFCTDEFIKKEFAKLENELGGWETKYIPRFLNSVWHEFIEEETWNTLKQFKNPTINYKELNRLVIDKIKKVKSDIF